MAELTRAVENLQRVKSSWRKDKQGVKGEMDAVETMQKSKVGDPAEPS